LYAYKTIIATYKNTVKDIPKSGNDSASVSEWVFINGTSAQDRPFGATDG